MAFTATYNFQGLTVPNAYIRVDGSGVRGGKDIGYTGTFRVYASQDVRTASPYRYFDTFVATIPYQSGDPYPALYAAAKINYPDAADVIAAVPSA